jgi:WD40 repeat protein
LAYQRSKLFIGTERGFAAIIDISELNSALVLDKHFRKFIDGNVWHAMFQQSGDNVVLASSNLHLLNTTDRTLTPVGQNNSISEFGRKNLLCFDSRFVLAGNGSCVVLYDLLTLTKVESIILPTFSNTIRCLEPLPGRRIASGSEDSRIVLWDLENECSITSIATNGSPWCMLYMHSDLLLAGINNTVNCYNIDTIELVSSYDIGFSIRTLTYLSPELFLVTCDDGIMIILELKTMTPVIQFPEIPQTGDGRTDILGAELLDDGRLVTCCRDRRLRIWQLVNVKLPSLIFKKLRTCNAFFDVNVFFS